MASRIRQTPALQDWEQSAIEAKGQIGRTRSTPHRRTMTRQPDPQPIIVERKRRSSALEGAGNPNESRSTTSKRLKADIDPTKPRPHATPNRSARSLANLPTPDFSPSSDPMKTASTPSHRASQSATEKHPSMPRLPTPLTELFKLHRALVRAISLHVAHNGTISPIPLSDLLPSASKIWGKRQITTHEVRRCIAIYGNVPLAFDLFDFGTAGTCIEFQLSSDHHDEQSNGSSTTPFDEEALQAIFETNLVRTWETWSGPRSPKPIEAMVEDAEAFIKSLQLVDIPAHPSLTKSDNGSTALGQARLRLLTPKHRKASRPVDAETGLLTPAATPYSSSSESSKVSPKHRKSSLYARLASKAASSPTNQKQTTEQVAQYALQQSSSHFLPELTRTLSLLSKGKRRAFGLPDLLRTIRESSRSIVEDSVVKGALEILGGGGLLAQIEATVALAPEYVKIVRIGEGVVGVVVHGHDRPRDLDERVKRCIAGF